MEKIDAPLFGISQLKFDGDEKAIYDYLGKEPFHIEQIIAGTKLTAGSINAGLVSLQLKGLIKQLPGSFFLRN
jgi:DNA processing protein